MVAYSGAISASATGARWEDALALCADMTSERLSADVTWKKTHWGTDFIGPVSIFWFLAGNLGMRVVGCISRVMFEWFMPVCQRVKVICYNAIIQACGGQWRKALQALEDLQQQMLQFLGFINSEVQIAGSFRCKFSGKVRLKYRPFFKFMVFFDPQVVDLRFFQ